MQIARPSFCAPKAIFWTAFGLRLAVILIGHTYKVRVDQQHFNFGFEAGRIARSLVTGHGYANPFNGQSGPTAWLPPLYPLLMALAFKLFGIYTNAAALFLLTINSLFSALIAPAIYEIAARCFDANGIAHRTSKQAAPVALWSAWLWAAYPAALQYAIHWIWEMSLTTCLFTWTLVLALRLRKTGEPQQSFSDSTNLGTWLLFGFLWGLIALSNASLLLIFPASLLWILWPTSQNIKNLQQNFEGLHPDPELAEGEGSQYFGSRTTLRNNLPGALLACLTFAIILAPWIIRNERTLHAFVPTRSNLGIELYQSTLDANDGLPWGTTLPLWTGDPEFQRYVRMGEIPYGQLRGQQAKQRILARPGLFLHRTVDRFFFFWDGTPHPIDRHPAQEYLRQLSYCFLSACGILGLLLMLKRRVPGGLLFASIFLLVPLPYYLVTVQPRFRHPIEPLIAILGVYLFRSAQTGSSNASRRA